MEGMSVGDVAARLAVSPSTVRMWGTRYGLTASRRSAGGHRRYTEADLARLQRMRDAVNAGVNPAAAAAAVLTGDGEVATGRRGGPGGAGLAVPGADRHVRGLARAASRLDEGAVTSTVLEALERDGVIATWGQLVCPVLVAAGEHWRRSGAGVEIEHLLTQAVTTALTQSARSHPKVPQDAPVLLAAAPQEEHVLPLYAARAALAERGVPARFLGPRTPLPALVNTARVTRPPAVLVWMTMPDSEFAAQLPAVRAAHRRLVLLLGGPGWRGAEPAAGTPCRGLDEAVAGVSAAWSKRTTIVS